MAKEIEELTFSWGVLVEILFFIGSVMVIYFTQKARIDKLEGQFESYFDQNEKDKAEVHDEIESIKSDIKNNYEKVSDKIDNLKTIIHQNQMELMKAINQKK